MQTNKENTECTHSKTFDFQKLTHGGPAGTALRVVYTIKTNTLTLQTRWVTSAADNQLLGQKPKARHHWEDYAIFHNFSLKSKLYKCK